MRGIGCCRRTGKSPESGEKIRAIGYPYPVLGLPGNPGFADPDQHGAVRMLVVAFTEVWTGIIGSFTALPAR